jgi:chromosomal replication initiator protein
MMKNIIQEKWEEILLSVKLMHDITDVSFRTWLAPLKVYDVQDNLITILSNPDLGKDGVNFISKKYGVPIKVAIEEITGKNYNISIVLPDEAEKITKVTDSTKEMATNKNKYPFLNPRYTFDTFVVGTNNNLAHAASLAVAESPAEVYNPLFIYGGVGLGKTHLMHSIAHFILERNPSSKVLYVTSETFTNELIDAIRNRSENASTAEFREKYRNIDVLLIDDIQFIIGKESTQEEFFHTFNTLHESKKQIIISSDKPPKDIETLEERLRSRFEWGLTVDIQSPDYETRMAILKKKEELDGLQIDNEVMKYIATNVKSNIRELEGALTKIVAFSRLEKKDVTVELAEKVLKDLISPNNKKEITVELIVEMVSEHFSIAQTDIYSTKKSKNISYPRQICMFLSRKLTEQSLTDIGKRLGNRDHTTILHGIDKINTDLAKDLTLQNTIEVLSKKINPQ